MSKINFAGGEPFLYGAKFLGPLVQFCARELQPPPRISIVTNGSKVTSSWMEEFGQYLTMLTVSIDSFDDETNTLIGRRTRGPHSQAQQTHVVEQVAQLCHNHNITFRINTVVNRYNWQEDMTEHIARLQPSRWKIFQVLPLEGENQGQGALRDVSRFLVTGQQFDSFVQRHRQSSVVQAAGIDVVAENNEVMKDSYMMVDEEMYLLDCTDGGKKRRTPSLVDPQLSEEGAIALIRQHRGFDADKFAQRDGHYYKRAASTSAAEMGLLDPAVCQGDGSGATDLQW